MVDEGELGRVDTPPLEDAELPPDLERWFTNLVDTLNEIIRKIETLLP